MNSIILRWPKVREKLILLQNEVQMKDTQDRLASLLFGDVPLMPEFEW